MKGIIVTALSFSFALGVARAEEPREQALPLVTGISRIIKFPFEVGAFALDPVTSIQGLSFKRVLNRNGTCDRILFMPKEAAPASLILFDQKGAAQRKFAITVSDPTPAAIAQLKAEERSEGQTAVDVDLQVGSGKIMEVPFDVGTIYLTDPKVLAFQRIGMSTSRVRNVQLVPVREGITDVVINSHDMSSSIKYYVSVRAR